jgi:hypothetical protein
MLSPPVSSEEDSCDCPASKTTRRVANPGNKGPPNRQGLFGELSSDTAKEVCRSRSYLVGLGTEGTLMGNAESTLHTTGSDLAPAKLGLGTGDPAPESTSFGGVGRTTEAFGQVEPNQLAFQIHFVMDEGLIREPGDILSFHHTTSLRTTNLVPIGSL